MTILSLLILVPAIFALASAMAPPKQARWVGLSGALLTLLFGLILFAGYDGSASGVGLFQFSEKRAWFPVLKIQYSIGLDGASLLLVLLTAFLSVAAIWFSGTKIQERENEYYAFMLALEATIIGAFTALDLVLFYVFFEACLVPAYFLIGIWGGRKRIGAATKFFVYTVAGSLLMLVSIIALYINTGTFDIVEIHQRLARNPLSPETSLLIFLGFAAAFAVKTGLFPFHTWLPDAYAEAPSPVTVILSGAMAKLGTYGFYRFGVQLLPESAQASAPVLMALGVISIIYAGLVAATQRDVKRVLAYSSISHLGFVVVGLFANNTPGLSGALLQMVNHGITSGALFLITGIIEDRRGSTKLQTLGGLWEQMPLFGRIFLIAALSSVGLPLTNSFVGEFQILLGAFQAYPVLSVLATTGVIWSALYMFQMFQKAMYGAAIKPQIRRMHDLTFEERVTLIPFVLLIFWIGIQPAFLQRKINGTVTQTLSGRILGPEPTTPGPGTSPDLAPTEPLTPESTPTETPNPATGSEPTRGGGPPMPGM